MPDTSSNQYVTAFFDTEAEAEAAVDRVVDEEGISREAIRLVPGSADADLAEPAPRHEGFFAALADLFMPSEDRYAYAEGLSRGGYLVSVTTTRENHARILDILDDEGTVDMDAREESWRAEGWAGYQGSEPTRGLGAVPVASTTLDMDVAMSEEGRMQPPATGGASPSPNLAGNTTSDEGKIDVVEERLRVGKRNAEGGRVRVRSYVVETPVEEDVTLRDETVRLDRKPVDRAVSAGDAFVDRTLEATETSEEAVISKDARVTEEISLEKAVDTRTETVRDTVRRTEVEVEDDRVNRDR